jgi:tRNA G18 (ribose-2'-O)-methylase SpoU
LDPAEAAAADVRVSIPMPGGTESLNAAVAGAIVAYELALWRNSE